MNGTVSQLHALLPVPIRLPGGRGIIVDFVVDTGFTGQLALPIAAVTALGLPFVHRGAADLADDTTVDLDVFEATIEWQGAEVQARVLAAGRRPLLGTALLADTELLVQFWEGGSVTVKGD